MEKEDKEGHEGNQNQRQVKKLSTDNEQKTPEEAEEDPTNRSASVRFASNGQQDNQQKRRKIYRITSGPRRIGKASTNITPSDYQKIARAEMDSRADTVCGGATFELYDNTGKVVDVGGFHPSMELLRDVTVGTIITAVDLKDETIIAVFHQGLYFGDSMEHSLIPPAQLWDYGITCDITPKWASKGKSIHGIYAQDENVYIPFKLNGHMPYFNTRLPTEEDKEPGRCRWINFTSEREWEPYSDHFQQSEDATTAYYSDPFYGMHRPTVDNEGNTVHINSITSTLPTIKPLRYISATSTITE